MKVELISYSQPSKDFLEETGFSEIQDLISYCARVSNPGNQLNTDNTKLINYLLEHKHFSPFEMVNMCLSIETTRDIGRQILRHRSFSFQEFSQRYADPTKDMSFVYREARLQDQQNRQNSIETDNVELHHEWTDQQDKVLNAAKEAYIWAIENGIAKEQARAVLPEGMTLSRMYMNGTLRSWIHYIDLRASNGTQKEHMDIAVECAKVITEIFPTLENIRN